MPEDRVFGFWDWVGGRYSVWSAIGLPVMIAVGPDNFRKFLRAHTPWMCISAMRHWKEPARHARPHRLLASRNLRLWQPRHRSYDQRLSRLPAYLQQLDMESNGKSVTLDGKPVSGPTGPVVWGEPGTNGQHAFFQLLHQGTDTIPLEFIVAA
ncbi:glucose-6-phosphate isomerase, partial [Brucella abortus]|nr:glucose-6-phosphate isomerase [Brucella abortus]